MKMKRIAVVTVLLLALPALALASVNFDLRIKGGNAAGADKMTIDPIIDATGSGENSTNFQVEVAISPLQHSPVGPVFSIGFFNRRHSGTVDDLFAGLPPTKVDYNASGLDLGAGVRVKANANLHFEGKLELGLGSGKPDLTTPGVIWNQTKEDSYVSATVLIGAYYTFTMPRLQLGLEVGAQSFSGDFQIFNNAGFWEDGKVEGSGGVINFVLGYRF